MLAAILPRGSARRKFAVKTYRFITFKPDMNPYERWAMENNDQIRFVESDKLARNPLISIIIPAYNTPQRYILPCVYSVVGQSYQNWELVIVDASSDQHSRQRIQALTETDKRIKVVEATNKGIAANTNVGLKECSGDYAGFLDHDDLLTDDALYEVAKAINAHPQAGIFYSDEDKVTDDGLHYLGPHFKPDWSPDLLTHVNYITHFMVVSKSAADKVGGFDSAKDGAQDYDFALKITDLGLPVVHIPKILYHWRIAKSSTAADISNKPYIKEAGVRALSDHYDRQKIKARVRPLIDKPGFYETTITSKIKPTVIITNFANITLIKRYVELLKQRLPSNTDIRFPETNDAHNLSPHDFLQTGLKTAGEHVILINDFVFPESVDWPKSLASLLELDHIHAATSIIYRPDKTIQDAGIVYTGKLTQSLFEGEKRNVNTYFGDTDWTRNVDELSGKIVAVRRSELVRALTAMHGGDIIELTQGYTRNKGDKYNTVLATSPLLQLRGYTQQPQARFFNPNLSYAHSGFELAPSQQQALDALLKLEEDLDEN